MGTLLLPVAAIENGEQGVKYWAIFESILVGIALPPLLIGTSKKKYDLKNKWKMVIGD
jgi:hypothetical protein